MHLRKSAVLAGAVLAAIPVISHAASFSYQYESGMEYTLDPGDASPVYVAVTPVTVGTNSTVTIPVGATLLFGIQGQVTGNVNAAATSVYAGAHPTFVPPNLGIAVFGLGFTNNSPSTSTFDNDAAGLGYISPTINPNFGSKFGGTDNGSSGYNPNSLSGGNQLGSTFVVTGANGTSSYNEAAYGSAGYNDLVSTIAIDGIKSGTSVYTPTGTVPGQSYVTFTGNGGTTASAKPSYTSVNGVAGTDTLALPNTLTVIVGTAVSTSSPIISLTSGTTPPTGYGVGLGNLVVHGSNGSYVAATATPTAASAGYYNVSGFTPTTTDPEVYALKLNLGTATAAAVAADITAQGANSGVTASVSSGIYQTEFPGYQIILTSVNGFTAGIGGTSEFGFNFANDTTTPADATVTVAAIAAVPEPATAAGVVLGAAGLLLGRRRARLTVA